MKIFESIAASKGLQPFALAKIAIALSIRTGDLASADYNTNTDGLELNRQTIFGEYEKLFELLLAMEKKSSLADEEFFPIMVKAHIDRGAKLLQDEVRYGMKFYINLVSIDDNL